MIKLSGSLWVNGLSFQPSLAESISGVMFSEKKEIGTIGTTGPHKGKPMPYGSASLDSPNKDLDLIDADVEYIGSLERLIPACYQAGAESVDFSICCYFASQCNFEFSPQVLACFARLGVTVTMSCYEVTETELLELRQAGAPSQ